MKIAFFSPLPPARSGIADYSSALIKELSAIAEIHTISQAPQSFDPTQYDLLLYQLGNNGDHAFVYEMAIQYPGIVVLHEANLHHLITDITIRKNDWVSYLKEVEFDGGDEGLAYGQRVFAREVGPDYDGLPMIRRILSVSRGAIAHSHFVEEKIREAGFTGPVSVIPHGAWLPEPVPVNVTRSNLGMGKREPLIGVFGHLKPYKRIAETLRAFRRLIQDIPQARLILVGEPHIELPLESLIQTMGLSMNVRLVGHTPIEEFTTLMEACDIIVNLRYPTVGETSGTLLRSFGYGKPTLISDIGAFSEFPDDICLKVPVDQDEEALIYEYLKLLIERQDLAQDIGKRAQHWVKTQCSWKKTAEQYLEFLKKVDFQAKVEKEIRAWTEVAPGNYVDSHLTRLVQTVQYTPQGTADDHILEMGAYMHITPVLKYQSGYGTVRGCYYGPAGTTESKKITSRDQRIFECEIDLFDAEKDRFPYDDESFQTVLCCELVEHLPSDPMHMMSEINRILKPNGHLVLTTPNISSLRALHAILHGYHPGFFPAYLKPSALEKGDSRHNREYTAREAYLLLHYSGFEITLLDTGAFKEEHRTDLLQTEIFLKNNGVDLTLRGDGIYIVGKKVSPVRERYPDWLYSA